MTRAQLAHVLRAAARIANNNDILVIGSQAILGSHAENELPREAVRSIEADLVFYEAANATDLADQVDGAIGELSQFHETNTYYAQGVDLTTATLPPGWRNRLVRFTPADAEPAHAVCLDPHDLAISKLVAMREKDQEFVQALLDANLLQIATLKERSSALDRPAINAAIQTWLDRYLARR